MCQNQRMLARVILNKITALMMVFGILMIPMIPMIPMAAMCVSCGMVDLLLMTSTRAMENLILLRYKTVDGIWYPDDPDDPDGSNVRLVWHGGYLAHDKHTSNGEFNPFTVQNSLTGKMHVLNFHIL